MKRTLLLALVFLAGLCAGRLWQGSRAGADSGDPPPVATENGDTNGDGERDISDAVYLLQWLFMAGAEPAAISRDCPPRFVDNGDGTVTDTETGLMWLQRAVDSNGDGSITEEDWVTKEQVYELAQNLSFAGYDDWDVPLTVELVSLVQRPNAGWNESALDPLFDTAGGRFWIASTNAGDPCHGASFAMDADGFIALTDWFAYLLAVRTP